MKAIDAPITLDELKDHIRALLPDFDLDTDEESGELIIFTNRREAANGDLEELDYLELEETIAGVEDQMLEPLLDDENEPDDDDEEEADEFDDQ